MGYAICMVFYVWVAHLLGFWTLNSFLVVLMLIVLASRFDARRTRRVSVALYDRGIAVEHSGRRKVTYLDDIDEVWYELRPVRRIVHTLRLVDYVGREHEVPVDLERGDEIVDWVKRRCSAPLLAEARQALAAGEELVFGKVRLDAQGISVGYLRADWTALEGVELGTARIDFFRRRSWFIWQRVGLDEVPHPSLFARLVSELARCRSDTLVR